MGSAYKTLVQWAHKIVSSFRRRAEPRRRLTDGVEKFLVVEGLLKNADNPAFKAVARTSRAFLDCYECVTRFPYRKYGFSRGGGSVTISVNHAEILAPKGLRPRWEERERDSTKRFHGV